MHCVVIRGDEKGHFEYGGSTVIVLTEPGKIKIREDIEENSLRGAETPVKLGEPAGYVL